MDPTTATVLVGLLVGGLVGLSGLGGGVVLLPLLILGLDVPPLVAVGSAAAVSALTKIGAAILHWRHGNVDGRLVATLAAGSLPGALLGVSVLYWLQASHGATVDEILTTLIGVALVSIPTLMLAQALGLLPRSPSPPPAVVAARAGAVRLAAIGFVGGLLVGVTSVGAGSVIMLLLIALCDVPPRRLVGTDVAHAVLLTGLTGALYTGLGIVDVELVGLLLVGSVPGSLLGARLAIALPGVWLRAALLLLLFGTGAGMLAR